MLENMATGGSNQTSGPSVPYFLALWNLVIRPPRAAYDLKELGPSYFDIDGIRGRRTDLRLQTERGIHLECTYYRPEPKDKSKTATKRERVPVVIYLHGNSSSRLETLDVLRPLLRKRVAVFCYDSAGCGLSEGEYVSLGHFEQQDLACIIRHLRKAPGVGPIGIWGRSMGAATALLHSDDKSHVNAIICDSAFASLPDLMRDIGNSRSGIQCPPWLINSVISLIRMRVKGLAGFDIEDVVPVRNLKSRNVPALFIHARNDNFISVEHTRRLYEEYGGIKECIEIGGDHNSSRGPKITAVAVDFLVKALRRYKRRPASAEPQGTSSSLPVHLDRWQSLPPPPPQQESQSARALSEINTNSANSRLGEPSASLEHKADASAKNRRHSCPPRELPAAPSMDNKDGVTPLPKRGGGTRNPSPWEPSFIYEDTEAVGESFREKPARILSNREAIVDIDDQENFPPRCNAISVTEEKPEIAQSRTAFVPARSIGKEEEPLCRLPIAAALPPAPRQVARDKKHGELARSVAEDPEIRPVPNTVQPSLLTSSGPPEEVPDECLNKMRALAEVDSEAIKDGGWCQPRHNLRHESLIATPDGKVTRARRRASSFPWLCCGGFTPGT